MPSVQRSKNCEPYIHHQERGQHEDIQPNASCQTLYQRRGSKYDHSHDALCAERTHAHRSLTVGEHGSPHSSSNQSFPSWTTASRCRNSRELLSTYQAAWSMLAEHTTQNIVVAIATTATTNSTYTHSMRDSYRKTWNIIRTFLP